MEFQGEAADGLWQHCKNVMQALRIIAREKSFFDPGVSAARIQLRAAYEAFLLQEYSGAQDKQVEQALWKTAIYAVIEEFRKRLKAASAGGENMKEHYLKAKGACLRFLKEASLFYAVLILKLQAAYGSVGFQLEFADHAALDAALGSAMLPPRVATLDCRLSVYRCLICLGDLARYYTMIEGGQQKKDWSTAEKYYFQAVTVFPEGGNSFNQLAVLSTYSEAELPAVYFYYRSLGVAHPFQVARENLLLLFEQNRVHYEQLGGFATQAGGGGRANAGRGRGRNRDPAQQQQKARVPIVALLPKLSTRFVRVHGVLFTKINMDTFGEVLAGAFADLEDLLSRAPVARGGNGEARKSDALLMQLAAMTMFVAWNINYAPPDHRPGYSEILQRAELKRHVLALAYGYAAALTFAAASVGDMRNTGSTPLTSPLLAPLNVLLQWLSTQPDYVRPEDMDEAEAKERCALWRALAKLLLLLPPPLPNASRTALPEDWHLRAFAPLTAAHSSLEFLQPQSEEDSNARLRLHRVLLAISGISAHHPASQGAAADASQPALAQEEHAAAAELHRAVQRVLSEAQSAAAAAEVVAAEARGDGTQQAANGASHQPDVGLGFVSEDEDEEVILYQPHGAAGTASLAPSASAPPAGPTAMDIMPNHVLSAATSHEIVDLPAAPATMTCDDGNRGTSFDPFSVYASAHGQATTPQPQTVSLSERLAAYTADVPSPMTAADLTIGHAAAAAGRTVAHADDAVPAASAMFNSGDRASEKRPQGEEVPCKKRLAPPPVLLSDNDCGPSAIYVPASGAAAAAAAAATREVLGTAESGTFSPSQQQRLMQPYAGVAAVAPPPSNLPQPSSSFASGSFSRRGSPAAAGGAAVSGLPSASDPNSHLMGPPAPIQQPDITHTGAQQQQMGISASGDAQPGAHFGVPLSTEQLLNRLHGSTERQAAQLPGRSYGQGGGVYGAGLPMPPPASGLPSESRLFSNADAGGAGALFSRDLFASQRAGMSRPNSMMSFTDAPAAAGTPLDSRPVSRSSVGVRSQADTDGGRGTPQPGLLFAAVQQQQQPYPTGGAAGLSSLLGGSAYDQQLQQQQQQQQQAQAQAAMQQSWANSGGFYMGGDRQPQPPPQPSGLGFYTHDSQSIEAHLLAQAYQGQLGRPADDGLAASGGLQTYLSGRLSEPALPAPGGGGWLAAGLGLGQQAAGDYGAPTQPGLHNLGYNAQMHSQPPWAPPGPASTAFGAAALGSMPGHSFPQQRAADQTAGGLVFSGQQSHLSGPLHSTLPGQQQTQQQPQQQQQYQPEHSLASLSNAELQQRLALMSSGNGLGQGWASAVPSPAGMLGVGVMSSTGLETATSLNQQAFPGGASKQAGEQLAGIEGQAAAGQGGGAANGDAGWSWLDAFEARQKALAAQAAGAGASAFPFPGAGGGNSYNVNNIYGV